MGPSGLIQLLVLTRHFFNRFFLSGLFSFEEQMKKKLYILLAMIAPMGWFMCSALFLPCLFAPDNGESWSGKCVFIAVFYLINPISLLATLAELHDSGPRICSGWVFQLTESRARRPYFTALKKAVFFYEEVPEPVMITL
jgi:hypothetical protein